MTPEQKLLNIVNNAQGDDLERAIAAFGRMSEAQLDKEYGQSGQTRRQILADYQEERKSFLAAKKLLHTALSR